MKIINHIVKIKNNLCQVKQGKTIKKHKKISIAYNSYSIDIADKTAR